MTKFKTDKARLVALKASQTDFELITRFQKMNDDTSLYMKTIITKLRNAIIHQTQAIKKSIEPFKSSDEIQTLVDIFEPHEDDNEQAIDGKNTVMLQHREDYENRSGAFKYMHQIHDNIEKII